MSQLDTWRRLMVFVPADQKRLFLPVALSTMLLSLLEAVGVGAVVPLVMALTSADPLKSLPVVAKHLPVEMVHDRAFLAMAVTIAFGTFFLFKSLFSLFTAWLQAYFVGELQRTFSTKLYARYLEQEYLFHVESGSSTLINRIQHSVTMVVNNQIKPSFEIAVELLTLLFIVGLVVTVNPLESMFGMLAICGAGAWFYLRTKKLMQETGARLQALNGVTHEALMHGLSAFKDVRMQGREGYFHNTFAGPAAEQSRLAAKMSVMNALPRLIIETVTVLGILVVVAVMASENRLESIASSLALLAAAAFRLMPSVNRITMGLSSLSYGKSAVAVVLADLELPENHWPDVLPPALPFTDRLDIDNVTFRYPTSEQPVLKGVSLSIRRGESIGFIGKTGAGKSTLIDLVLGLISPASGSLRVDGADIAGLERAWQRNVGYVPQVINLIDDTIRANIAFGLAPDKVDPQALQAAVTAAQLDEVIAQLPAGLDTRVGDRGIKLSGGQRQRVGIARALYGNPEVLVLDEATSSLDNETEREVMRVTQDLHGRKTVIIIAHRTTTLMQCDRIVLLKHGLIECSGTPLDMANAHPRLFHQTALSAHDSH